MTSWSQKWWHFWPLIHRVMINHTSLLNTWLSTELQFISIIQLIRTLWTWNRGHIFLIGNVESFMLSRHTYSTIFLAWSWPTSFVEMWGKRHSGLSKLQCARVLEAYRKINIEFQNFRIQIKISLQIFFLMWIIHHRSLNLCVLHFDF